MYNSFKNMYTSEIISLFWHYDVLNTLMMFSGWKHVDMHAHTHTHTHTHTHEVRTMLRKLSE